MTQTIETRINAIRNILNTVTPEGWIVRKERAAAGALCKGMVSIYSPADIKRLGASTIASAETNRAKGIKIRPTKMYAFYAGRFNPQCIGSVAIYTDDAAAECARISRRTTLFGQRIKSVSLEMGHRPFVDVQFYETLPARNIAPQRA